MSIRLKLILSYFVLIFLSLLIMLFGFLVTTGRIMEEFSSNAFGGNDFRTIATTVMDTLVDLEYIQRHAPELFNDEEHMAEVETGINGLDMALYVSLDDVFVYNSQYRKDLKLSEVIGELEFDGSKDDDIETADFEYNDHFNIVARWDINNEGRDHVYLVYEAASRGEYHWNIYGGIYRVIGAVIIMLMIALTFIITKAVIRPLNKLEEATHEIRQGNLDFSIKTKQSDEFGRVMNAFDTMRVELKHSIEQQVQYEENRKELIASISHDLKTPITSIKGYVEGIRDGVANDEEKMSQYLEVIHQKSIDLDRMIDDLFLYSKLDLNSMPFNFSRVNAKRFFDDCGDEMAMDAEKSGFDFNFTNHVAEDVAITVDAQQFRRVISNIISNAIKYSDDEKRIDFTVTESKDKLQVAVRDYGKGIDPESLEKIFEKFYRADPSRNQEVMGSGLGLAIAKQIMNMHQGIIRAESVIGKGTSIYLEIGKAEKIS